MLLTRLIEKMTLLLPGKRIYFIYTHENGKKRFRNGVRANTEISHFSLRALSAKFPKVVFLRLQGEKEARINTIRPQDVVLGHIGETFLKASARTKKMIAFYPWSGHEDRITSRLFNCIALEDELKFWEKAASIILLTSEYNKHTYVDTNCNVWHSIFKKFGAEKRIRFVHQPIDHHFFKRVKWDYTTSDFLYIGNDAHMKCLPDSKEIVKRLGKTLHLYGVEGKRFDHCSEDQVRALPALADFFIQPGMWEGQCVAILEAAARGFIPVVSPETGYPYSHPFLLRFGDIEYNVAVLKKLLQLEPAEKKELGDALHQQMLLDSHHNSWNKLTDVLVEEVLRLI